MKKRHQDFAWLRPECFCGVQQLVSKRGLAKHQSTCLVHAETANKWVRETALQIMRAMRDAGVPVQQYFQEWPVGSRDMQGNFATRMAFHVDLVFQVNERLMGVEVHGGAEHVTDAAAIARDEKKVEAWDEELQQQRPDAKPRLAGPILVVWAPELMPAKLGGAKTRSDWQLWVNAAVYKHVHAHMLG